MHRMGSGGNKDVEFQHNHESMNYLSSQMNNTRSGGGEPFFSSGWDPNPMASLSENYGGSSSMVSQGEFRDSQFPAMMENQGIGGVPHFSQYPLQCFGSGNFSEMVGSYMMPQSSQIADSRFPPNYVPNQPEGSNSRNGTQSHEELQVSEEKASGGGSLDGKRRKRVAESNSPLKSSKNAVEEPQNNPSGDSSDAPKEQDEKKMKVDQTANSWGKQVAKQAKEDSHGVEAAKDSYIHVRARRGQATNSHSLAERVRREKISERMRLLQELVPGCNKITGKAVMLDEIINYVQSLQQQVEFLSMKLATVNPELNVDLERLLSKDILHSQGGGAAFLGFGPAVNSSRPFPPGVFPGNMPNIPNQQFSPLPQGLDSELHNVFQMGFDSSVFDSLGPNSGRMKSEL